MTAIDKVPVIDIRLLPDDPTTLESLDRACREWGFFQVTGHGIPAELTEATLARAREFFALPIEAKRAVERTETNTWGFYDRELTKNLRDWKEVYDVGPLVRVGALAGSVPQWPVSPPQFRQTIDAFREGCKVLSLRLLEAIGANLGAPAGELAAAFAFDDTSFLRLNYYPVCPDPAPADAEGMPPTGHLGIHPHTDSGALTVLLQDDCAGLQVENGGRWYLVEPCEGALVVNIGDIVQVWSNDRYRAAPHRVVVDTVRARYSAPFFFNPSGRTIYSPLHSVCDERNPARYRPIVWEEFRAARAAGDYADYGEEVQIAHYLLADQVGKE